jgi:hypothetical protein
MFERIEGQPTCPFGSRIAHPVSDPSMRHLMDDNRKKKGDDNQSKSEWICGQQLQKSHSGYPAI